MEYIYFCYGNGIRTAVTRVYKRLPNALRKATALSYRWHVVEMWEREPRRYYNPDAEPFFKIINNSAQEHRDGAISGDTL